MKKHHGYSCTHFNFYLCSSDETNTPMQIKCVCVPWNCMSIKMGFHFITPKRNDLGFFCSKIMLFIMLLLLLRFKSHSLSLILVLSVDWNELCVYECVAVAVVRCYVFKPAVDIIQVYSDKAAREHYGFYTSSPNVVFQHLTALESLLRPRCAYEFIPFCFVLFDLGAYSYVLLLLLMLFPFFLSSSSLPLSFALSLY